MKHDKSAKLNCFCVFGLVRQYESGFGKTLDEREYRRGAGACIDQDRVNGQAGAVRGKRRRALRGYVENGFAVSCDQCARVGGRVNESDGYLAVDDVGLLRGSDSRCEQTFVADEARERFGLCGRVDENRVWLIGKLNAAGLLDDDVEHDFWVEN